MSNRIIHLELETVTPVFIGGASPRRIDPHTPIRASAVRGMLRMWFRAAAGAVLVPSTLPGGQKLLIKELARLEAQVFGNTERVSPFAVLAPEAEQVRAAVEHIPPGAPERERWAGLRYLGYGLFEDRIKGAQAIAEKARFTLRLALRKSGRHEQAGLRELLSATAWLWLNLGALGARSRRGFGGLRLYPGEHAGLLCPEDVLVPPAHHQALGEYLARGTKWAWEVFYRYLPATLGKRPPDHDDDRAAAVPVRSLAGIESFAALPHEFSDARDALDYTGRLFRDYRSTLERGKRGQAPLPDYTSVKAGLQLERPPGSVERAAFGLPLPFYFRSLGGVSTRLVPELPDGSRGDRLASPLCVRICPVGDARSPRYVPVLYNWAEGHGAQPLLGCGVHDTASRGRVTRIPDSGIITSFIDWARRQPRRSVSPRPPRGR